jgi:hypothetical protein
VNTRKETEKGAEGPTAVKGTVTDVKRRKHSQWSEVFAEIKDRQEFFARHGADWRLPGEGLSYAYLQSPPIIPTVAFFFRRFTSFYDAMREWRVQRPPNGSDRSTLPDRARKAMERAAETLHDRKDAADRILAALEEPPERARALCEKTEFVARFFGGSREACLAGVKSLRDNYDAAATAIESFCIEAKRNAGEDPTKPVKWRSPEKIGGNPLPENPRLRVAWELESDVSPLLEAYRDPAGFFREVAPRYWPSDFAPAVIGPFTDPFEIGQLGETLHTWGVGALLNPNVRAAFDGGSPEKLMEILAWSDAKDCYREGAPQGATKGRPKPGRPRKSFEKLRDKSKEQRLYRQGSRRREK